MEVFFFFFFRFCVLSIVVTEAKCWHSEVGTGGDKAGKQTKWMFSFGTENPYVGDLGKFTYKFLNLNWLGTFGVIPLLFTSIWG